MDNLPRLIMKARIEVPGKRKSKISLTGNPARLTGNQYASRSRNAATVKNRSLSIALLRGLSSPPADDRQAALSCGHSAMLQESNYVQAE